jgi:hypothetical protein
MHPRIYEAKWIPKTEMGNSTLIGGEFEPAFNNGYDN